MRDGQLGGGGDWHSSAHSVRHAEGTRKESRRRKESNNKKERKKEEDDLRVLIGQGNPRRIIVSPRSGIYLIRDHYHQTFRRDP